MRNVKQRKEFTLLELLVVIAIFAILLTLLLPSLSKARYEAKRAVCFSNLKQYSIGITFYCSDNNRRYPNLYQGSSAWEYKGVKYHSRPVFRQERQSKAILSYMGLAGNTVYGKTVQEAVTCPLIAPDAITQKISKNAVIWLDLNNDGVKERYPKFPFIGRYFKGTYSQYYSLYNPVIKRPMIFQGERTVINDKYLTSDLFDKEGPNVLVSDPVFNHGPSGGYLTNHPPNSRSQSLVLDERYDEPQKIWRHHTKRGFAVMNHFSSNFIYTDGSGKMKKNINRSQIIGSSKFSEYLKDDFE